MKVKQVWHSNATGWMVTEWRESKLGGKRRFLKTRAATQQEIANEQG